MLDALLLAGALEAELASLRPEGLPERVRGPLPVLPGLAAVLAARGLDAPGGDVLSLRRTSPAALVAAGLDPELLARQALGSARSRARGRDPGGVPRLPGWGLVPAVDPPGTLVEVMAGVALAFRLRGEPRVALLATDADDADSGYWHEGLNFAAVRRAPLVLVVHPGSGAARSRPTFRRRGDFYGIDVSTGPGDDLEALVAAVAAAVARAREGEGTQLVEVDPSGPEAATDAVLRLSRRSGARIDPSLAARRAGAAADAARSEGDPGTEALASALPPGVPTTPFSAFPPPQEHGA